MNKKVSIFEEAYIQHDESRWLVCRAIVTHARHVVREMTFRVPWDMEPDAIGFSFLQEHDCQEYYYYYSFALQRLDVLPEYVKLLPDQT